MITKIYLVRHGETEWNKLGKFQGCCDINLSQRGIEQANYLSKRFDSDFDYIYTSPLKRAYKTAEIISKDKKIEPIVVDDLREINFGKWEGLTIKQISENFPKEFDIWQKDSVKGPLCGGDLSIKRASERATCAIMKIVKKHPGKSIIIVAHGGIIKAGLIGIFGWNMTMYHRILLANTCVNQINFTENFTPIIVTLNDTSHLPKDCKIKFYV